FRPLGLSDTPLPPCRLRHMLPGLAAQLHQVPIVGKTLLQVRHARRISGANHGLAIGPLDPKARPAADIVAQFLNLVDRAALAAVHREDATALRAAEGGVLQIVVEYQYVAGGCRQRDGRNLATLQAPGLDALANVLLEIVGERLANAVAAGDDPQRPGLAG